MAHNSGHSHLSSRQKMRSFFGPPLITSILCEAKTGPIFWTKFVLALGNLRFQNGEDSGRNSSDPQSSPFSPFPLTKVARRLAVFPSSMPSVANIGDTNAQKGTDLLLYSELAAKMSVEQILHGCLCPWAPGLSQDLLTVSTLASHAPARTSAL